LQTINLPLTITSIGHYAFNGCTNLASVTIPSGVTFLGVSAFQNCYGLTSIVLPEGLEKIGENAFGSCTNLVSANIPLDVEVISTVGAGTISPFSGCSKLDSFTFAPGITRIPRNMFAGCTGLTSITIPSTVATIEGYAFSFCTNLEKIIIPDGTKSFGARAFDNCPKLTIYCSILSFAFPYALNNNLPFVIISEGLTNSPDSCLDRSQTSFNPNFSDISSLGYFQLNAQYAFKSSVTGLSGMSVEILLPPGTTLVSGTLTLDGVLVSNYSFMNRLLTIPVTKTSGTIRLSIKPNESTSLSSYAMMNYKLNGEDRKEVIGTVISDHPILTIVADAVCDSAEIEVIGVAPPNSSVDLSISGEKVATVTALKNGNYSAKLTIPNLANFKTYEIKAVSSGGGGNPLSATTKVRYEEATPALTEFTMEHFRQRYNYPEDAGLRPILIFRNGIPFTFQVKFRNTQSIERVFVTSNRNGLVKKIEAFWDVATQSYTATGFFDPSNHNYVPGEIGVEYLREGKTLSWDDVIDFGSDAYLNILPDAWRTADCATVSTDGTTGIFDLTLNNAILTTFRVTYSKETAPAYLTAENAEDYGFIAVVGASGNTSCYVSADECSFEVQVFKPLEKELYRFSAVLSGPAPEVEGGIFDAAGISDATISYKGREIRTQNILNAIYSLPLGEEERIEALRNLDRALTCSKVYTGVKYLTPIVRLALGLDGGPVFTETAGLAVKSLDALTVMYLESLGLDLDSMATGQKGVGQISFRWAIDPSGYVYDAITNNRLSDVTVTVYFKEELSNEVAILWNAAEYQQRNPLLTDNDGRYAWDVPEGFWQVKCELDGYQVAYSDWLPVPPPQTEVNIGMIPIGVTLDANVTFYGNGGSPVSVERSVSIGSALGSNIPPNPTRLGYSFAGWNTQEDGKGTAFIASTVVNESLEVYAQWTVIGIANGWYQLPDKRWMLFENSVAVTSAWRLSGGHWYYLGVDGIMVTGSLKWDTGSGANNKYYYLDANGRMQKNTWYFHPDGWRYHAAGGEHYSGWQLSSGLWYYLNPNNSGLMVKSTRMAIAGITYGFNANGAMQVGWYNSGTVAAPVWRYYSPVSTSLGKEMSGWVSVGGYWYYLNASNTNIMVASTRMAINGATYGFDANGRMQIGWYNAGTSAAPVWRYYSPVSTSLGKELTGWVSVGGYWYYLDPTNTNRMVTGNHVYAPYGTGSPNYSDFDANGRWLRYSASQ